MNVQWNNRLLLAAAALATFSSGWVVSRFIEADGAVSRSVSLPKASAADILDEFDCPQGQSKIVLMHGEDDNFARNGIEPARIRRQLLTVERFAEIESGNYGMYEHRDYDEGGKDKILIDHFDFPRGIISGILVSRIRAVGNVERDSFGLGQFDVPVSPDNVNGTLEYRLSKFDLHRDREGADAMIIQALDSLQPSSRDNDPRKEFLDFVNSKQRPDVIDVVVLDDTMVDYIGFALCQEPAVPMATTFSEFSNETGFPDLSYFTCYQDVTQPSCNPFRGDHLCSDPMPIACYKHGSRKAPDTLAGFGLKEASFVGGEVRLSRAIRPDQFPSLQTANDFCAAEFGSGWRVTSFHESTGAELISYSRLARGARGVVQVGDQPYGNCWDRPKSVRRP